MCEPLILLTPKTVYRMLTGSLPEISDTVFLRRNRTGMETNTRFWWHALQGFVPGSILDPYFNTAGKRCRALSDIMNRSTDPSLPDALRTALENGLSAEHFNGLVHWIYDLLDDSLDLVRANDTLKGLEERCGRDDTSFEPSLAFFRALRGSGIKGMKQQRVIYHFSLRIAWLILHATFGEAMGNGALSRLKSSPVCREDVLWEHFVRANNIEILSGAQLTPGTEKLLKYLDLPSLQPPDTDIAAELNRALKAAEGIQSDEEHFRLFAGWYVVANWTDPVVSLNDTARPTYGGAVSLARIPNGTPLYIVMASGYEGINKSSGHWGYTCHDSRWGYVPMTYLTRMLL